MQEKENILRIFNETKQAIKIGDSAKIKKLSDQTNNTASMTQDPDNIAVAVVVYSLSKIIDRGNYQKLPGWKNFYENYLRSIDNIIIALKEDKDEEVRKNLELIRKNIEKISGKLKEYIQDVFRKAEINKASKIYEHGISMEKTANLLGITLFELASYAGQKLDLSFTPVNKTIDIKKRIKTTMEMFG
jgi:hypothetical protein